MIGLFFAFGCKKDNGEKGDNPPEEPTYPIEIPFEEYSLEGIHCQWTNLAYDNSVIIINSEEEMSQYVTCANGGYSEIDFAKYSLICASGMATSSPVDVIERQLQQISDNEYSLTLIIETGAASKPEPWLVLIKVPKLFQGAVVTLNVHFPNA